LVSASPGWRDGEVPTLDERPEYDAEASLDLSQNPSPVDRQTDTDRPDGVVAGRINGDELPGEKS
jgi:hypothetical protein